MWTAVGAWWMWALMALGMVGFWVLVVLAVRGLVWSGTGPDRGLQRDTFSLQEGPIEPEPVDPEE